MAVADDVPSMSQTLRVTIFPVASWIAAITPYEHEAQCLRPKETDDIKDVGSSLPRNRVGSENMSGMAILQRPTPVVESG